MLISVELGVWQITVKDSYTSVVKTKKHICIHSDFFRSVFKISSLFKETQTGSCRHCIMNVVYTKKKMTDFDQQTYSQWMRMDGWMNEQKYIHLSRVKIKLLTMIICNYLLLTDLKKLVNYQSQSY